MERKKSGSRRGYQRRSYASKVRGRGQGAYLSPVHRHKQGGYRINDPDQDGRHAKELNILLNQNQILKDELDRKNIELERKNSLLKRLVYRLHDVLMERDQQMSEYDHHHDNTSSMGGRRRKSHKCRRTKSTRKGMRRKTSRRAYTKRRR